MVPEKVILFSDGFVAFLFVSVPLMHVWDTISYPLQYKQNMVAFEWDNSKLINDKADKKLSINPHIPFWDIQIHQ